MHLSRRHILLGATALVLTPAGLCAQATRIPFTLFNGKMFVEVTVNGQLAQAMIDSGAQWSAVSQAFAAAHGIRTFGRVPFRGIQGAGAARKVDGVVLGVGPVAKITGDLVALDLARLAADVRHDIDAVIGGDLFRAWVVDIDFEGQTLALLDRTGFAPPPGAKPVPLEPFRTLMTAAVSVEGAPPIRALVDLGSNVPLILSPGPARAAGLLDGRSSSTRLIGGHGAGGVSRVATTSIFTFGGEAFRDVPVMVPAKSIGIDANLGLPVLWRFRLYLDFGGDRMWLGQPTADRNLPFDRDYLGLETSIQGDSLKVTHVSPGSPAAQAGFRVGEVITALNGSPANDVNMALGLSDQPGQVLTVTLNSGVTRTVTLAAYY